MQRLRRSGGNRRGTRRACCSRDGCELAQSIGLSGVVSCPSMLQGMTRSFSPPAPAAPPTERAAHPSAALVLSEPSRKWTFVRDPACCPTTQHPARSTKVWVSPMSTLLLGSNLTRPASSDGSRHTPGRVSEGRTRPPRAWLVCAARSTNRPACSRRSPRPNRSAPRRHFRGSCAPAPMCRSRRQLST